MKYIKHIFIAFTLMSALAAKADTLTVMHYNLLYYNAHYSYSGCNATTNDPDIKDQCLTTIVAHVKPDIISVNEMGASTETANRLLAAINAAGVGTFDRAERDAAENQITNLILFNTQRVKLNQQQSVATSPRRTQFYTLQIVPANIPLTYAVTHLKAGEADTAARANAARAIMSHIAAKNLNGNLILAGDMNIYDGSEPAMTTLCNPSATVRLHDPIDRVGLWHNNASYADLHTQSTRNAETQCFVSGGLDDRFDLILTTAPLLSANNNLRFESLKALGNDGNRFNKSITSPTNTSVPAEVAEALYNMSDHLPVVAKFIYNPTATYLEQQQYTKIHLNVLNPIKEQAIVELFDSNESIKQIDIYDIMGNMQLSQRFAGGSSRVTLPTQTLRPGLYLLRIGLHDGRSTTVKVIKQ